MPAASAVEAAVAGAVDAGAADAAREPADFERKTSMEESPWMRKKESRERFHC